ncbi:MAG: 50S ribosomal protein L10 [Thaumarchaeota archaeon]|nr:50S ribosomal protein L10 [Nitrososphaerota archaeon]
MAAESVVKRERRIPKWKLDEVEELSKLISSHRVIAAFKLTGLRANLLHEIRKKLRGTAVLKIAKLTLFKKSAEKAGKPGLVKLVEDVKEPMGFIFSNTSGFKLKLFLDKNRIPMHAKAGERADFDVVVPEMNTGLPPGPVLSEFGKLGIPTKIEGGQIWIAKDTVVAKKGDEISHALASLLARLDIKAVLKGVTIERAYEDGVIITKEQLEIDLERFSKDLREAHSRAIVLSTEIGYVTKETIAPMLLKSFVEAKALAIEAEIASRETIREILLRAEAKAQVLKEAAKIS